MFSSSVEVEEIDRLRRRNALSPATILGCNTLVVIEL